MPMTDQPSVLDTVIITISEQSGEPVTLESKLADLDLDSLDIMSIMFNLEEELHLTFELQYDAARMSTVQEVADYISERIRTQTQTQVDEAKAAPLGH
jgi:acyl carrier protein